jgi:hypothetical protein
MEHATCKTMEREIRLAYKYILNKGYAKNKYDEPNLAFSSRL